MNNDQKAARAVILLELLTETLGVKDHNWRTLSEAYAKQTESFIKKLNNEQGKAKKNSKPASEKASG